MDFNKKAQNYSVAGLIGIAITLSVFAIVLGMNATILTQIQATQPVNSTAYNVSSYGLSGLSTLGSWQPTIALIIIAAVIITIILAAFAFRQNV